MKRPIVAIAGIAIFFFSLGCDVKSLLPPILPYPYESESVVNARADQLSADMTAYIKDWVAGRVPALMPQSVIPTGALYASMANDGNALSKDYANFTLYNPDTLDPAKYVITRPARKTIDLNKIYGLYSDPRCCYLVLTSYVAPFNSETTITGSFPYSRYFSIQPSIPFDARFYTYDCFGPGEAVFVDVDIEPDSGSVNPFRIGQNRLATNRNYTVTIKNSKGRFTNLMPNYGPPNWRMSGNVRYGSGIQYMGNGFWGKSNDGGKGRFNIGQLYLRYYGVDNAKDGLGGVPLPRFSSKLSTGEKFLILSDFNVRNTNANLSMVAPVMEAGTEPDPNGMFVGKDWGWKKMFGVAFNGLETLYINNGYRTAADKTEIRNRMLGFEGRGYNQPAVGNWEFGASLCTNINYLGRAMSLGAGKVIVLSGKMPTFPNTRGGTSTNTSAEMRYMSFCTYFDNIGWDGTSPAGQPTGSAVTAVMDDEFILDANRNYVLCYSRPAEKPTNATSAAKVTWVAWGPNASAGWMWRWLSVGPEWMFAKTPHENNLTWKATAWSSEYYDPNKIGKNDHSGFLAQYQPKVHYMLKADFESLGTPVTEAKLNTKAWYYGCGTSLAGTSGGSLIVLAPLGLLLLGVIGSLFKRKK